MPEVFILAVRGFILPEEPVLFFSSFSYVVIFFKQWWPLAAPALMKCPIVEHNG